MWAPTCLGDPGKVTDAEYHCLTTDGGGVHTNSGVPNHGYALLVDGGTFNGQTVSGLGLTKAAHIYWRAQSVYQTPTSKFGDHADALEASCTDLIGVNLDALSTGPTDPGPSGQSITAADCVEVSDMIAAVEFRTDPTQCNFQPLLQQNPPALCANQKNPPTFYDEDFEDGLAGWTLTNTGVFAGWPGLNWAQDTTLPGGRSGSAAFAADPDAGNCDGGAGDISGVMRMESPAIHLPNAEILKPRLTFEHYIASETGFDGGNLKISVNGGAYALVPASAFTFNAYNLTLVTAAAGQHQPARRQPGVQRDGRRRGPRELGPVADRPDEDRHRAWRHDQAALRLRHGRLRGHRRLVRRRRQSAGLQREEAQQPDGPEGLTGRAEATCEGRRQTGALRVSSKSGADAVRAEQLRARPGDRLLDDANQPDAGCERQLLESGIDQLAALAEHQADAPPPDTPGVVFDLDLPRRDGHDDRSPDVGPAQPHDVLRARRIAEPEQILPAAVRSVPRLDGLADGANTQVPRPGKPTQDEAARLTTNRNRGRRARLGVAQHPPVAVGEREESRLGRRTGRPYHAERQRKDGKERALPHHRPSVVDESPLGRVRPPGRL